MNQKNKSERQLDLLQSMLQSLIKNHEERLIHQFKNKLLSLNMQTLKYIDLEVQSAIFSYPMLSTAEIKKKIRDLIIGLSDIIMQKTENFRFCVSSIFPDQLFSKLEQQPGLKEQLMQERSQAEHICPQCQKGFLTHPKLQRHIDYKHKYSFPCYTCLLCFESELVACVHDQILHTNFYPKNKCPYCEQILTDTMIKMKHLMKMHLQELRKEFNIQYGRNPLEPSPEAVKRYKCYKFSPMTKINQFKNIKLLKKKETQKKQNLNVDQKQTYCEISDEDAYLIQSKGKIPVQKVLDIQRIFCQSKTKQSAINNFFKGGAD